ncbi:MAG: M23 family metallopeptidase [Candidatus Berkelbacteria bacterium]|nr:M23 family metallopeptidase [Candidatus Berkelbacteria bacterium]
MPIKYNRNKQKGIIPAVLAVIIALVSIALILLIAALIFWIHHLVAGLIGGGNQPGGFYGAGNCATTQTLNGVTLPLAKGPFADEQHLATTAESFSGGGPTSTHDQDERHYQVTNFSVNCPGCAKEGFTPAEGNGSLGGGTGPKPDPSVEPWLVNVLKDLPRNSKLLVHSTKTGETVVTLGGYEKGPGDPSFAGGARIEVLHALGISHAGEVEIGFAQDQNLPLGPITCTAPGSLPGGSGGLILPFKESDLKKGSKCKPSNFWDCAGGYSYSCNHGGFDYSLDTGVQLYAAATGKIVALRQNLAVDQKEAGTGGNFITVLITEGRWAGYSYEYHHLYPGSVTKKVGDMVVQGEPIAKVDNNGQSSGPHLHFQVNKYGTSHGPNYNVGATIDPRGPLGCI